MRSYFQIPSLFLLFCLSISLASGQTGGTAEKSNYQKTSVTVREGQKNDALDSNGAADSANDPARFLASAPIKPENDDCAETQNGVYEDLSFYVGDSQNRKTGSCLVVENVPLFTGIQSSGDKFGNAEGLFFLETQTQTNAGGTFLASPVLAERLAHRLKNSEAKVLRVKAIIAEFNSDFEVFRAPVALQVEGIGENGRLVWTVSGARLVTRTGGGE
jgi:hypothetical protein